jgi:hypothetical protein
VDERRHGRRARHGVGQPHEERNLGALAGGAHEEEEHDPVDRRLRKRRTFREDDVKAERPDLIEEQKHRHQEGEVPNPIDDERLVRRCAVAKVGVPEADEQVRAEADALPAQKEHRQVVRQHEVEHGEDEEVQVRKEAPKPLIAVHVPDGIGVDHAADAGHDQRHKQRQLIDAVREAHVEVARRHPRKEVNDDRLAGERHEQPDRQRERNRHNRRPERSDERLPLPQLWQKQRREAVDHGPEQRKQKDETNGEF